MSDDWLFEKKGEVDPEVDRLEGLLSEERYKGTLPELPERESPRGRGRIVWLAAAAVLVVGGALGAWLALGGEAQDVNAPEVLVSWPIVESSGELQVGSARVAAGTDVELEVGSWMETGAGGEALVQVADIGTMRLSERTRMRIKKSGAEEHRLEVTRGKVHAKVVAPPRLLVVETPSGTAVDLGCEYTLEVGEDGGSVLEVRTGEVAMEGSRAVALVPAGAMVKTSAADGPGIPYRVNASEGVKEAADALAARPKDDAALRRLIASAEHGDGLTLWHSMARIPRESRPDVLARVEMLYPGQEPDARTRELLLAGDREALESWGSELLIGW